MKRTVHVPFILNRASDNTQFFCMQKFNVLSIILGSLITIGSIIVIENLFCLYSTDIFFYRVDTLPFNFYTAMICLNLAVCFIAGTLPVIMGDEQLKHSFIIGLITSLFSGMNFYCMPFPVWYHSVSLLLFIPITCLGGYIFKKAARFPEPLSIPKSITTTRGP